jgi:DNA-binding protein HU-beta
LRCFDLGTLAFPWEFREQLNIGSDDSLAFSASTRRDLGSGGRRRRVKHFQGEAKMNKLELVEHVAAEAELTKVSAAAALEAVLDGIAKSLKKGDEVRLVGFGTFSVRERAAGKGRNPATGKEIKIAASKNARFKAGSALKSSLNAKKATKKA